MHSALHKVMDEALGMNLFLSDFRSFTDVAGMFRGGLDARSARGHAFSSFENDGRSQGVSQGRLQQPCETGQDKLWSVFPAPDFAANLAIGQVPYFAVLDEARMGSILRRPQVEQATGLSRSTLYAMMAEGAFPKPVKLGKRAVGWRARDVAAWLESRKEATV